MREQGPDSSQSLPGDTPIAAVPHVSRPMQGVVYELLNERSEPMNLVLKTIPHGRVSAVTGFLPSMEREWAVGHRLALYCTTPSGGALPRPPFPCCVLT